MQVGIRYDADGTKLRQRILEGQHDRVAGIDADRRRHFLTVPEKRGTAVCIEPRLERKRRNAAAAVDLRQGRERRR
jgi:hypothetical protein